ncbi:A/G-specific adenine glycosylase [Sphingobacterium sp. SGR-19]|uniref:A/G-specific adenine glycosylase n=1 Tax=Sphingobacterium sp. SGR-19 TaxID=2710886 RepID=UPI0013E9DEEF|nr:A/G-specific adenine glycosylase [Sphingobacterium sp. SGR-19]NGM66220.1 A/G-specific adenine glycosylase [Sphingobacterium sp. SGR-19]
MSFAEKLMNWYREKGRDLPWRTTHDAYIIWLSEIILQQTRVEQGTPYFHRFVEAFPIVTKFAEADEEDILRLWQGLGYYSRARNMHKAAKMVVEEFQGVFPSAYEKAIRLPGVGEYTAAAIASFSVNEPRAVVDGNVYRVLARYFGIKEPINSVQGKKMFAEVAQEMLDKDSPGIYNQAIMDFGALQCKPKNPLCEDCIFRMECFAFQKGLVDVLPVKLKGKVSRNRYFHYFIVREDDRILMSKRGERDVWTNLYEFPMIETIEDMLMPDLMTYADFVQYFEESTVLEAVGKQVKHVLSHQNIYARFYVVGDSRTLKKKKKGWNYHYCEKIDKLAKHKLIFSFLEKNVHLISAKQP